MPPVREIDMTVAADDGLAIAGTLALPAGDGPHPAVVLLSPRSLDRYGNTGKAPLALGRALATALAARSEVSTVGAIGYSEGALHAAWLAAYAGAAAVVLLGCPARTGEDVYLWWAGHLRKEDLPWPIRWPVRLLLRPLDRTPRDQVARVLTKLKATTGDVARVYGMKAPARLYREFLGYDPRPDLAAIRVPVLALTGDKDRQVDPGPASLRTYRQQYRLPVDPGLLEDVAKWVSARLQGRGQSAQVPG